MWGIKEIDFGYPLIDLQATCYRVAAHPVVSVTSKDATQFEFEEIWFIFCCSVVDEVVEFYLSGISRLCQFSFVSPNFFLFLTWMHLFTRPGPSNNDIISWSNKRLSYYWWPRTRLGLSATTLRRSNSVRIFFASKWIRGVAGASAQAVATIYGHNKQHNTT